MPKFRNKPVTIEAVQHKGNRESFNELIAFCPKIIDGGFVGGDDNKDGKDSHPLYLETLDGARVAEIEDWIIKDIAGEFYPCKNEIFLMTYEPVTE